MIKWPFGKPGSFLDAESEAWHVETWAWLLRNMGGVDALRQAPLVTPTTSFFPSTDALGHARVAEVLDAIKMLAGMQEWPCVLEAQPQRAPVRLGDSLVLERRSGALPLGTFGPHGDEVLVTYDPDLVDDPVGLVATLVHELAHYLLSSFPTSPPGGEAMEEFATDLATAAMGFGVFGAATALRFEGGEAGWTLGWSGQGYLHPRDWAFALAVFTALRGEGPEALRRWLRDTVFEEVVAALRYLRRKPELIDDILRNDAGGPDTKTPARP